MLDLLAFFERLMQVPAKGPPRVGFGLYQADLATRQLYRRGVLVRLQDQPFHILALLLEHPGEVVTREELQKRLWPSDTFVDFDEGLNTAIKKLRLALGDSPENPTFIETVPRHGYRFIAPVKNLTIEDQQESANTDHAFEESHPIRPPDNEDPPHTRTAEDGAGSYSSETASHFELGSLPGERTEIGAPPLSFPPHETRQPRRVVWAIAVSLVILVGVIGLNYQRRNRPEQRFMYFSVSLPVPLRDLVLSHNGQALAFTGPGVKSGGSLLWTYEIGAPRANAHPLASTEGASYPFWSADDKFIGFFADGKLKRIAASGGPVQLICDAPIGRGGTWNRDGVIVFAADTGVALRRVSATGGPAIILPGFEQKVATTKSSRWPVFLPDGKHFLFTSIDFGADLKGEGNAIYVAQLDSNERHRLVTSNANAAYLSPGYLLFLRNGTLMAERFDADRLEISGESYAVANDVEYLSSVARGLFTVSETGTLIYQPGAGATFSQLTWVDREGKKLGTVGPPARYANPSLSPDGQQVAVDIDDPESFNTDIWVIDSNRQRPTRISFDPGQDETPLWSHDGRHILWLSDRGGKNRFYLKVSDDSGIEESPATPAGVDLSFASALSDWCPDSQFVLYTDLQEGDALHLWVMPMDGSQKPYRFLPGNSADIEGQFSPDRHWVAYSSNESGKWQVYVAPFPGPGNKFQISIDGGQQPRWRPDGKELFFLSRDRTVMSVPVKTRPQFEFSDPIPLFQTNAHEPVTAEEFFTYGVSTDGQRFLINADIEQTVPRPLDIVFDWDPK